MVATLWDVWNLLYSFLGCQGGDLKKEKGEKKTRVRMEAGYDGHMQVKYSIRKRRDLLGALSKRKENLEKGGRVGCK